MQFIVDSRMPAQAKNRLKDFGELIEFETRGITYDSISRHPDIFFCPTPAGLVAAPNVPKKYFSMLTERQILYLPGRLPVGSRYPETAAYNALAADGLLIHNTAFTDASILHQYAAENTVAVKQGYTRCSLVNLGNGSYITCDGGIAKVLTARGLKVRLVTSGGVVLAGHRQGFLGGACGIAGNRFFICGSLRYLEKGQDISDRVADAGLEIVELYDGPVMDVGTILPV